MDHTDPLPPLAALLYAGPAETFVARRNDQARALRQEGDAELAKRIAALRRPSIAASTVNALPQEDFDALSQLATSMRKATATMDVEQLRTLTQQRAELIRSILEKLDLSSAVRDEVRATLLAVVADPAAEEAVRTRTLVRALSYSGLGDVPLEGAAAIPPLRVVRHPHEIEDARAALEAAQRRHEAAKEAFDAARAALQTAQANVTAAQDRLARLTETPTSPGI